MARGDLTDAQWERLAPLLPPQRSGKPGRPYEDHRQVLNGILWILRTGAPWRDLPDRYGPHQTCYDRFVRWRRAGLWERLLQTLHGQADAAGELAWEVADLWYHSLVLLAAVGADPDLVWQQLRARHGAKPRPAIAD